MAVRFFLLEATKPIGGHHHEEAALSDAYLCFRGRRLQNMANSTTWIRGVWGTNPIFEKM